MPSLKIPTACKERCSALNPEVGPKDSDCPLLPEHVGCVWREFALFARSLVLRSVAALRLGGVCRVLRQRSIAIRRSPWLVTHDLKTDPTLIDDLVQDVALALVGAVRREKLSSARPAIYGWLKCVVPLIVRERCRPVATAALAGVFLQGVDREGADTADGDPVDVAAVESAENLSPDEQLGQYEALESTLELSKERLTDAQHVVFLRTLRGQDTADIAAELGVTEGAVRLRLMHAKRRLAA